MNRTDRLLAMVLELQAHGVRRAEDLAATFEISKRTVYRDVQALCEAGVPVVAEPGRGYSLVEGYFLPPLRFSAGEAVMLLLGGDVMAQSFDAELGAAAVAASRKIAGALSDELRAEVALLRESIHFVGHGSFSESDSAGRLRQIRQAIVQRRSVRFRYYARSNPAGADDPDMREADPYGLTFVEGAWYVTAFCHSRRDMRNFRLDRMEQLSVLDRTFTRQGMVSFEPQGADRTVVVRALFDASVARWVREKPSFYTVGQEQRPEGLMVTLRTRHENDVLHWLLGWGASVEVLEPESLRERIAAEAEAIAQRHQTARSLLT